ncbi:MAG TPA: SBBP repeat-containing protein, partial [Candidatus Thalassarchaeaceae archaeon]|nr:SBBP repeat-containing protein [Candidatus Thalassarchaeaceae archaeon]
MAPQADLDDEFVPNYSSGLETLLWGEMVAGSSSTDSIESIELDAYGNTYVCGYFYNNGRFGNLNLNSMGSQDGFVAKIDPSGNWLWAKAMGGSSSDQCKDIDVDDGGNISITGHFYSQATFGSTYLSSQGSYDFFVAKLDTNGTWQWAIKGGGSSNDWGEGVAIDNSGNVYVTGYFYSSGTVYFGSQTISQYSYDDGFIGKINSAGQVQWAHRMYGSYYQRGKGIDVNDNGEIAITGEFSYWMTPEGTGGSCGQLSPGYQSSSYYRVFVAKYTTNGNCVWAKWAGYESSYYAYGEDVTIDNSGVVSLTGRFNYRM